MLLREMHIQKMVVLACLEDGVLGPQHQKVMNQALTHAHMLG